MFDPSITLAEIRTPDATWSLEAEDGALWLHYVVGGRRTVVPVTWEALAMMEAAAKPSRRLERSLTPEQPAGYYGIVGVPLSPNQRARLERIIRERELKSS